MRASQSSSSSNNSMAAPTSPAATSCSPSSFRSTGPRGNRTLKACLRAQHTSGALCTLAQRRALEAVSQSQAQVGLLEDAKAELDVCHLLDPHSQSSSISTLHPSRPRLHIRRISGFVRAETCERAQRTKVTSCAVLAAAAAAQWPLPPAAAPAVRAPASCCAPAHAAPCAGVFQTHHRMLS